MKVKDLSFFDSFQETFNFFKDKILKDKPFYWEKLCVDNFEKFQEINFPSKEEEKWRYSNLDFIKKMDFSLNYFFKSDQVSKFSDKTKFNIKNCLKKDFYSLVFVNGCFVPEWSDINIINNFGQVKTLEEIAKNKELFNDFLLLSQKIEVDFLSLLNSIFLYQGLFLEIKKNERIDKPIHILHYTSKDKQDSPTWLFCPRIILKMLPHSEVNILETFCGDGNLLNNPLTHIILEKYANLNYVLVQEESDISVHLGSTQIFQEESSILQSFTFCAGSKFSRHNLNVNLINSNATSEVLGLYILKNQQHMDSHIIVNHEKSSNKSFQFYKGILDDKSHAVFDGKVNIFPSAEKTVTSQLNKNLLLNNECRIDAKPNLEIKNDDIKASHGVAIGNLNEDEIYYLSSRGISPLKAKQMLSQSFAVEVVNKINCYKLKERINKLLLDNFRYLSF